MCYSARVKAAFQAYRRAYGAVIGLDEFHRLYVLLGQTAPTQARTPRAMDQALAELEAGELAAQVRTLVEQRRQASIEATRQQVQMQSTRLQQAQARMALKPSRTGAETIRVATRQLHLAESRLVDLQRTTPTDADARIYPGWYCPVMIWRHGRREVLPMRYQCRPAEVTADHDRRFPGTYNARRDNLRGYWRHTYGYTHAVVALDAFYEHVQRHDLEGRPLQPGERATDVVLEFRAADGRELLAAALYAHWCSDDGREALWSFALLTHDPPPEVRAAGHDRCIVPIRPEDLDAWLQPDPGRLAACDAILDRSPQPVYVFRPV